MGDLKVKICCKCKDEKEISEFNKNKQNKDGLHSYCKLCRKKLRDEIDKKTIDKRNAAGLELLNIMKKEKVLM